MRRAADILFIIVLLVVLIAGLARTLLFPKDINAYENRYAQKVSELSAESYLSGTFQEDTEAALNDQIPLSLRMKQLCNYVSVYPTVRSLQAMVDNGLDGDHTFDVNGSSGVLFYRGILCYTPRDLEEVTPVLEENSAGLNAWFAENPGVDFYAYYVESDSMMDFEAKTNTGIADRLLSLLALPEERKGAFRIGSFDRYVQYFYQTDHHWNYLGSYQAYTELVSLLGLGEPLVPTGVQEDIGRMCGSRAKTIGAQGILSESFSAFTFDLPLMTITQGGAPVAYGNEEAFLRGEGALELTYGNFYGGDPGEIVFDTRDPGRENILILGDSYDNAILKLLASHFGKTYSVDLRNYQAETGETFRLTDYLAARDIHKVLLIGSYPFGFAGAADQGG